MPRIQLPLKTLKRWTKLRKLQKFEYLHNEKSILGEIKCTLNIFLSDFIFFKQTKYLNIDRNLINQRKTKCVLEKGTFFRRHSLTE